MGYDKLYTVLQSFRPGLVVCGTAHWLDCIWIPILCKIPSLFIDLSNGWTFDPYVAPFGLPSLPCGWNGVVWKLVLGKWVGGMRKPAGKTLERLSGKPVENFFPTGPD